MTPAVNSRGGDATHRVMEGQTEDLDMEVNGVASQISLRPAPVTVLDEEPGVGGQNKIARLAFDELESAFLEQRGQIGDASSADLLARPTRRWRTATLKRWVGHSLFSSVVG
jgi:hypothetical protein